MAKDKLTLVRRFDGYRIQWELWEFADGEEGAILGEDHPYCIRRKSPPKDPDLLEHWAATRAVADAPGVNRDEYGYLWHKQSEAADALRAARAALRGARRSMPQWAMKAMANGWTPPRGRKP